MTGIENTKNFPSYKIHSFEEVPSTMNIAYDMALKGCKAFTVVTSKKQTMGRGRLNRKWFSCEGGLYFTLVLRPKIPVSLAYRFPFACSLVLAKTLNDMFDIDAKVKWPNDILVSGKKIAGILSEINASDDIVNFINIGIGLNVNNCINESELLAVSIKKLVGKKVSSNNILTSFLYELESFLNQNSLEDIIERWKCYAANIGKYAKVIHAGKTIEGTIADVDNNGSLILKLKNGLLTKILYGDLFFQQ